MAEGWARHFHGDQYEFYSAGIEKHGMNARAMHVMKEAGVDISHHTSDRVEQYLDDAWDYVITVCGGANEACPMFTGKVKNRLHIGFDDPSHAEGTSEFIENEFRRVRDEIKNRFYEFYIKEVKKQELSKCSCGGSC